MFILTLKPIIHCNAKYLASGVGVGQCPRRQNFALEIPTCWYILALPPTRIPDAKPKICITPDANPRRQSVEYRWRWAFWHWGWRWACTFHVVYVNFICVGIQRKIVFQWNMGLSLLHSNGIRLFRLEKLTILKVTNPAQDSGNL